MSMQQIQTDGQLPNNMMFFDQLGSSIKAMPMLHGTDQLGVLSSTMGANDPNFGGALSAQTSLITQLLSSIVQPLISAVVTLAQSVAELVGLKGPNGPQWGTGFSGLDSQDVAGTAHQAGQAKESGSFFDIFKEIFSSGKDVVGGIGSLWNKATKVVPSLGAIGSKVGDLFGGALGKIGSFLGKLF